MNNPMLATPWDLTCHSASCAVLFSFLWHSILPYVPLVHFTYHSVPHHIHPVSCLSTTLQSTPVHITLFCKVQHCILFRSHHLIPFHNIHVSTLYYSRLLNQEMSAVHRDGCLQFALLQVGHSFSVCVWVCISIHVSVGWTMTLEADGVFFLLLYNESSFDVLETFWYIVWFLETKKSSIWRCSLPLLCITIFVVQYIRNLFLHLTTGSWLATGRGCTTRWELAL